MRRLAALALLVVAAGVWLTRPTAAQPGFSLTVTQIVEGDARPGGTVKVALDFSVPPGFHLQSDRPRDPALIPTTLTIHPPPGVTPIEVVFPPSKDFKQEGLLQPLAVFESRFAIGVQLKLARDVKPGDIRVPVRLRYQACDDTTCFKPTTIDSSWTLRVVAAGTPADRVPNDVLGRIAFGTGRAPDITTAAFPTAPVAAARSAAGDNGLALLPAFDIRGVDGGYMSSGKFLTFLRDAEAGVKPKGLFEGRGPIAILFLIFIGGLALNLTPCVLPMIPINLAIIGAGAQAGRRSRGFWLGATYGGAMAVVYGVLGLVVILTAGTFGTINASPWFNLGIAALFVVLGLAMFDIVNIDFSRLSSNIRFSQESRGTFLLAFGMGAVAALLAGACVAPVVIQVVLFASQLYTSGSAIALALPFVLGLGMALPWPIAGAGLAALPKPGAWMNRVKYAFGVFILATAAYYGYIGYELLANRWVDPATVRASVEDKLKGGWTASLADGLATAQRDGKPVLIDLWATWCKNCLTMDKTTLADPAVLKALEGYTLIKFQAEDPDASPARELMQHIGAVGLPTYVVLRPNASRAASENRGTR
jgi:thioredoxin:protein disulfide reductase